MDMNLHFDIDKYNSTKCAVLVSEREGRRYSSKCHASGGVSAAAAAKLKAKINLSIVIIESIRHHSM